MKESDKEYDDNVLENEYNKTDTLLLKTSKKSKKKTLKIMSVSTTVQQIDSNTCNDTLIANDDVEKSKRRSKKRKSESTSNSESIQQNDQKKCKSKKIDSYEMTEEFLQNDNDMQQPKKNIDKDILKINHQNGKEMESTSMQNGNMINSSKKWKKKKLTDSEKSQEIDQKCQSESTMNSNQSYNGSAQILNDREMKSISKNITDSSVTKFKWKNVILNILEWKKEMSLKKLEKKVLSQYKTHYSLAESNDELIQKFHVKLNNMKSVNIINNRVLLN